MSDTIIEVKNLTKTYRIYGKPIDRLKESLSVKKKIYGNDFNALENVSFSVKRGENIGIIGTNGSGKSTLLKIITGVLSETSGSIQVNGKISALLELGAGFNGEYTGLENVYLNGTMMGYSREQMDVKVKEILEFAEIGDFIYQPVKTYSSGMFARLAFAVAINVEPEILIVDEALSVGDTRFQLKCMKKMKEMMRGGTTVLFVSHDINAIKRFCTRAIWINRGKVIGDGDIDRLTDQYLDFLKKGDIVFQEIQEANHALSQEVQMEVPFKPEGDSIAQVIGVHIRNGYGKEVSEMLLDDMVRLEVIYDVYDENVEEPVLGVALRAVDNDYVCGLNTAIDKVKIPWKYGRNRMILEYPNGVLAVGGQYYFDVALMDETASVNIHYAGMAKNITITTGYAGEGRYIIPHQWRIKDE